MEEDEPQAPTVAPEQPKKKDPVVLTEEEEIYQRLREFYLDIGKYDLFDYLGLSRRLYELTPVDNVQRMFEFFLRSSPFGLVSEMALGSKCKFGEAMQILGDEMNQIREITREWSAKLAGAPR